MSDCILSMEHITKQFAGVTALNDVSFSCERGKVHVIAVFVTNFRCSIVYEFAIAVDSAVVIVNHNFAAVDTSPLKCLCARSIHLTAVHFLS